MRSMLFNLIEKLVTRGQLRIIDHKGESRQFGDGSGPPIVVRLTDRHIVLRLGIDPDLALGEGYMDGRIVLESGTLYALLDMVCRNWPQSRPLGRVPSLLAAGRFLMRPLAQWNGPERARRNVSHHYDLDRRLYNLFLDEDLQYSCAYFSDASRENIESAQLRKKRRIAAKLNIKTGMSVLDIGCGWGGMGLYLAKHYAAEITGITLSQEQAGVANERAGQTGLDKHARYLIKDYREVTEQFDRIVSVGMFEHVGIRNFRRFFRECATTLSEDGVMLLHTMVRLGGPSATSRWIERYIFPGGYIPAMSEFVSAIEASGLLIGDVEILRLHYADTLRAWRARFAANRAAAAALYDERFCRMWEYYLAASEVALRHHRMAVAQILLTRNLDGVPLTRDYIDLEERRLRASEEESESLQLAGE